MLTLDILRHGALEGGVKYRGTVDDPLTTEGRKSMEHVWSEVAGNIDLIITSPRVRCAEPVKAWATRKGIEHIIEPRVAEMYYGDWEGKTIEQIKEEYPGMLERWREDPTDMRPPGGESPEELLLRVSQWWNEVCKTYSNKHLLLVTHSGTMRMLMAHILRGSIASSRRLAMPYGCWSRILYHNGKIQLLFHNREVVTR